jgi:hypothetical protein
MRTLSRGGQRKVFSKGNKTRIPLRNSSGNPQDHSQQRALKISSGNPLSLLGEYAEEASNFSSEQSPA